jgi:hypothetical protein
MFRLASAAVSLLVASAFVGSAAVPAQAGAASAERTSCKAAKAAVPRLAICVETARGLALAATRDEASRLASYATAAEESFKLRFARPPTPYAVVTSGEDAEVRALKALGLSSVLPWMNASQVRAQAEETVRQKAEAAARARGLTEEAVATAVAQAVGGLRQAMASDQQQIPEASIIRHELGHMWLIGAFWQNGDTGPNRHYGGPGPDWLDETAAVLMEDEAATAARREQFAQAYRGRNAILQQVSREELVDLTRFLSRDHPARAGVRLAPPAGSGRPLTPGTRVPFVSSTGPSRLGADGLAYYLQSRMFADYLIERSRQPQILGSLALEIASGKSLEQWLQASGASLNLPSSVSALDADWRRWLASKLGA